MMDCREELLNNTLIMLNEAGIQCTDTLKNVLVTSISRFEISKRSTEVAVYDDGNTKIAKLFLASKKVEGGSDATAKTRWYIIKMFDDDIGKPFSKITSFDILLWLADLQKKVSLSTAESYRNVLSSMFTWMTVNGIIQKNPMENISPIKHPNPIKTSFTPIEVDALKGACKNKVDRAIVELLLSSGLRCEELCNLKWQDIDWTTKDIKVIEGKGGKNRVTMMDDVTKKYLLEYKKSLKFDSEYVFAVKRNGMIKNRTTNSVWRKLKKIADKANVSDVNPHKFRHTFATTLYKRGLDVRMIQKLLGHSNINTTMIYIDGDIDMLRDAYKKCIN